MNDDAWADLPGYARAVVRPRVFWDGGRRPHVLRDGGLHVRRPRRRHARRVGSARHRCAVRRSARDPTIRRRRVGPVPASAVATSSPRAPRSRGRATIISSAKCVERDRHDTAFGEIDDAWHRGPADVGRRHRRRTRRLHARATCRSSTTPSPFRASSCRTTSTARRRLSLSRERSARSSTASTARSSVRESRRSLRVGTVEQPAVGRHRLLRSDAADRGNRGRRPVAADDSRGRSRRNAAERVVRRDADRRSAVVHGHAVRVAHHGSDSRRALAAVYVLTQSGRARRRTSASNCSARSGESRSRVTATYTYVHAREIVDGVDEDVPLTPRHSAGIVGMWERGGRRPRRRRVVLHRRAAARGESVSSDQRTVHGRRAAGGAAVRTRSAVHQRREPDRRPADAVGSAASSDARGGRPMDGGRVGAARRPQHQRRDSRWRSDARCALLAP